MTREFLCVIVFLSIAYKKGYIAMADKTKRLTIRLSEDDYERVKYWATQKQCSVNEYVQDTLIAQIKRENYDYDIPDVQVARLNQLIDVVLSLSSNVKSLEQVTTSGFDSLLGLTRGDDYLLEHEDGEI